MGMVDLKRSKKDKKTKYAVSEGEDYGYGLELNFESEQCRKVAGLKDVKAGDMVEITGVCKVKVVRVEDSVRKKGDDRRVQLQLQKVEVKKRESFKKSFDEMAKEG